MTEWLEPIYADYHAWKGWGNKRDAEGETARALAEMRMAGVAPPAALLEIGYGDGAFLRCAKAHGYQCAGLERDDSIVEELIDQGIDARNGTPDQFADRKFDIIAAFDVFEHIPTADLVSYLQKLSCIISTNGRLVARFPNMASPFGLINQYGDITHITALSPSSFVQVARLAGFEPVKIANGVTIIRASENIRGVAKLVSLGVRKVIEFIFSFAYYGRITPLAPSVVVVLRKS